MTEQAYRCGSIAIVGRPNVGKSTLLNHLIGQKIAITSRRPQTTRHSILGIKTTQSSQAVYVDTPGLHLNGKRVMNRYLNKTAAAATKGVDLIVFMVDRTAWFDEDQYAFDLVKQTSLPVILVINKIDLIKDKTQLLPHLEELSSLMPFNGVFPLSAKKDSLDDLELKIVAMLPFSEPWYPEDQVTDKSIRFLISEIIREKLTRRLGQELPYALTVQIEQYKKVKKVVHINAIIWIEKKGQKRIVIGTNGDVLKDVGVKSRKEIEPLVEKQVNLQLWVKVKSGWSDNERLLKSFGYQQE